MRHTAGFVMQSMTYGWVVLTELVMLRDGSGLALARWTTSYEG